MGACSALAHSVRFQSQIKKIGIESWRVKNLDLIGEIKESHLDSELVERIKLLLWAQVNRASLARDVLRDQLKVHHWTSEDKVSRREFLKMGQPRYEPVPYIQEEKCAARRGCRLCLKACSLRGLVSKGDSVNIEKEVCTGCGACILSCPGRAIIHPAFSPEQLDKELEGLLLSEKGRLQPRIVAVTCQTCSPILDEVGADRLHYPPSVFPLAVPCYAIVSAWLTLRVLERGGQGLVFLSDPESCRARMEPSRWQRELQLAEELCLSWGMEPNRIKIIETSRNNLQVIEQELWEFTRRIGNLPPTPFIFSEASPFPPEGPLLTPLLRKLTAQMGPSGKKTLAKGFSPLGKVEVDPSRCTACGLCTLECPTKALTLVRKEEEDSFQLLFQHDLCNACGLCGEACPEKCLQWERGLEWGSIGKPARILFEGGICRCSECGVLLFPQPLIHRLQARIISAGGSTLPLDLCSPCKIRRQLKEETLEEKKDKKIAQVRGTAHV